MFRSRTTISVTLNIKTSKILGTNGIIWKVVTKLFLACLHRMGI